MVFGYMQPVKVPDKFMTYITLFHYDREYYPHSVDIIPHLVDLRVPWILSPFCGYYPRFVDIVNISAFRGYYL